MCVCSCVHVCADRNSLHFLALPIVLSLDRCEGSIINHQPFLPIFFFSFPKSFSFQNTTVKNLNSAHTSGWILYIVPNFLTPPSSHTLTHPLFPFFTFLCHLSITAPLLFWSTSCSFFPASYFSVIPPSILPAFLPSVCSALGQCKRGPEGWHGSLAQAHKTSY